MKEFRVKAEYKGFELEKVIGSKNEHHAVLDFLNEVEELVSYATRSDLEKELRIHFVEGVK
ncbi:hypothetical protein [Streptococcus parauberis]|uniref:hypothetical protein n=1 Tax=Streptococcus parauberis TaxID=1348 RepID=UPI000789BF01|nr:hypothetical protein [Streptococcus parauberis]KYP17738.1 hypothetical protein TN39_01949 [Streptococcus parauberis]KYP18607.1 hypothetical protein AKL14_00893 [Streptococcus parauberis]KYP20010.1 hypothetical protein AKL13_00810 [Streptococcus parauberis]KYP27341.1 hypothetical protein TM50_00647 [Streptococcus parauberis]KYP27607.1 hypothetical protein TP84_00476 [Streptococcus parauberis]